MQKIENSKYINNFLQKIRAEDGLSKNTILSYGKDLEILEIFLQSKKISFENCTKEILKKYFSEDAQQDLKNSSVSRKISCFKHFFNHPDNFGRRFKRAFHPLLVSRRKVFAANEKRNVFKRVEQLPLQFLAVGAHPPVPHSVRPIKHVYIFYLRVELEVAQ